MRWDSRIDRLERLEQRMPGEDPEKKRAHLMMMLEATRRVLAVHERMAAKPFAERAKGCSPPECAERIFGDAAMAASIAAEKRRIAELEAELAK